MRKKITLLTVMLGLAVLADAQSTKGPVLTFEETDHNFGFFDVKHANQSCYFRFTNTGDENLVITNAFASCNCTVPEYPKYEIAPGQTDSIKVCYDGTNKRPGVFRKTITIDYNGRKADESMARVTITGEMTETDVIEQIKEELDGELKKE